MSELHSKILEASRHVPLLEEPAPPQPQIATLRDQFAMAALTGLLANPKLAETALKKGPRWFDEVAYQYADGMLKERELK
jgi:hypothetical protein